MFYLLVKVSFAYLVPESLKSLCFSVLSTLTQNENFIMSLDNCFVSVHVVVRFTQAYRDFVADNEYAIFYSDPRSIQAPTPDKRVPYVARAEDKVVHLQL